MTSSREGTTAPKLLDERGQMNLFGQGEPQENPAAIRYGDLVPYFLKVHGVRYKPKTRQLHETSAKHLIPFFGQLYLFQITPRLLEEYMSERIAKCKPRTVNIEMTCLRCHLRRAEAWGWLAANPFRFVRLLPDGPPRVRYCAREELTAILHECPPWLREIVTFAVATGMRKGEILSLRWDQVKTEQSVAILTETKTGQMRGVPLNQTALSVLRGRPRRLGSQLVFWNPETGEAWGDPSHVFHRACARAGVTGVRFHDLRHTCASWLVQSGVEINTVREILGHKSIRMTLRYAHLTQTVTLAAAVRLDAAFF